MNQNNTTMQTEPFCLNDLRVYPDILMSVINRTFETMNIPVVLNILPFEGRSPDGCCFRIEVTKTNDDDLNEPLGTPACNLGEACESCQ